ncbi:hypothetical protein PRIPAC_75953 [Pristionchus pacificus]|uniref:Uncharacterized protein n=1 Tax=Pristionchus pacificus TaxID=54126 RepID=A0A2A6BZM1_PRIPA|nr:hypothetical protein PRIPAC_75953 [Pristionchus pacificus]|eukprot:PDM71330.1 hypothetical protein PRIPAC_37737 [Pristionchus pacificus]
MKKHIPVGLRSPCAYRPISGRMKPTILCCSDDANHDIIPFNIYCLWATSAARIPHTKSRWEKPFSAIPTTTAPSTIYHNQNHYHCVLDNFQNQYHNYRCLDQEVRISLAICIQWIIFCVEVPAGKNAYLNSQNCSSDAVSVV